MAKVTDLLDRPVYGMAQVDWILRLHLGTARRWIDGYERRGIAYPPVVRLEPTGSEIVTWGEFCEARLLAEFRDLKGVPLQRMRPAVERLRDLFGTQYPLAHARPWLDAAGKELVMQVQDEVGLEKKLLLVVVRNDQLVLTMPSENFVKAAEFDASGVVRRLRPVTELDDVWLDPVRQFGDPVVRSVPTEVIAEQVRAGDDPAHIAEMYELSQAQVLQAIRYELIRGRDAKPAA
jgi:uncharacterized protein (DUF433 family)